MSEHPHHAVERLKADLATHDAGGLAYAAADCESVALVRADDLREVLSLLSGGEGLARAEAGR